MHEPYFIYMFAWVNAIGRSGPSASSQRAEICFSVNKGVSESTDIALAFQNKLSQTPGKSNTATVFQ